MVFELDIYNNDVFNYVTLNEDVKLKADNYNEWDIEMVNGDYVNCVGQLSLRNAIIIAIMTRFQELEDNPVYNNFGCRVHELVKANKTGMTVYKMEVYIQETLQNMRRISEINSLDVVENGDYTYTVNFSVISINDEMINGSLIV